MFFLIVPILLAPSTGLILLMFLILFVFKRSFCRIYNLQEMGFWYTLCMLSCLSYKFNFYHRFSFQVYQYKDSYNPRLSMRLYKDPFFLHNSSQIPHNFYKCFSHILKLVQKPLFVTIIYF